MSEETISPYVGLRPFQTDEDLLFFGRDVQVLELLKRLHTNPLVAVVGGSGSGKSSLVRAGLIPALKGGYLLEDSSKWKICKMKPGQGPMYNFAETILKLIDPEVDGEKIHSFLKQIKKEGISAVIERLSPLKEDQRLNFFLLVDQFEELFRYQLEVDAVDNITESIDFVNIILKLTEQTEFPFYIVLTMRSDFIGDCAQFHGLPEALNKSQYLIPRLNRQEMKRVIEGPSKLYGKKFSPALTSKLLNDTTKVKDELPLLQHALMRIWDFEVKEDQSGELDLEDYKAIGGIQKALSIHADEALEGMNDEEVELSKEIFKALTTVDENGRKIRRPVLLSELKDITETTTEKILDILNHFIRDKRSFIYLQPVGDSDDQVIDISHESLIRRWDTLGEWVDEEAESASYYLQLAEATRLNQEKKKDYLTGSELVLALEWKDRVHPTAVWANRYKSGFDDCMTYLDESEAEYDKDIKKEVNRKRVKKITQVSLLGLIGLVVGIFLYMGYDEMKRNKAFDTFFKGRELISDNPTIALDSMMTAIKMYDIKLFKDIASSTYIKHELYEKVVNGKSAMNSPITFSNDSIPKFILNNQKINSLRSIYIETGKTKDSIVFEESIVAAIYITSSDGYLITFEDGSLRLIDKKGIVIKEFNGDQVLPNGGNVMVKSISFNHDKSKFVTGYENGHIIIWDFDGNQLYSNKPHNGQIISAILSPDEKYILSASYDDTVKLIDVNTKICKDSISSQQINSLNFSSDGQKIIVGSNKGYAYIRDFKGALNDTLTTGDIPIYSVDISPDDSHALTVDANGTLVLWDISKSKDRDHFEFLDVDAVYSKFTDDGEDLVIVQLTDGQYNLFDYGGKVLKSFGDLAEPPSYSSISYDTAIFTELFKDAYAILYDGNDKKIKFSNVPLNYYGESPTLNFTPNRKNAYGFNTSFSGIALHSWDIESGIKSIDIPEFDMEEITAYEISPTKGLDEIVVAGYSGQLILFKKSENGYKKIPIDYNIKELNKTQQNEITSLAFSPLGDRLLCGHASGLITLIDLYEDKNTSIPAHNRQINKLVFSPSGASFLSASQDKTIKRWSIFGEKDKYSNTATFIGNTSPINELKYSKDGRHIISGSSNGRILLWDMNGTVIKEFKGHNGLPITSIYFDNENGKILSGSKDGTVRSWNWNGNYESLSDEYNYSYTYMNSLKIINDSRIIVTYIEDEKVKEFDLKKKELISVNGKIDSLKNSYNNFLLDSISYEQGSRLFISPNGNNYVLYKKDDTFEVKELFDGDKEEFSSIGQWGTAAFSDSSNKFVIGRFDGNLSVMDINTSKFKHYKPKSKSGENSSDKVFYSKIVFFS